MTLGELADRVCEIRENGKKDVDAVQVSVSVACFELPLKDVVVRHGKCVLCDARTHGRRGPTPAHWKTNTKEQPK